MLEILSAALSFVIVLLLMPGFIRFMRERGMIQPGYELGPDSFKKREKPPNMGGLIIALGVVVSAMIASQMSQSMDVLLVLLIPSLGALFIGFADDYLKDTQKNNKGLLPRYKLIGQTGIGLIFAIICNRWIGSAIHLPFTRTTWDLHYFYIPLMTVLFVFMTNSANIQDGVDGLMTSVTFAGSAALGAIAVIIDGGSLGKPGLAFACFALTGACLAFLVYNQHPAKIFMGDTGSMFIGGLLTGAAMMLRLQLWLLPLCFTMIISSLSVIAQRIYFKMTGGKRLILMSPLHHHFEQIGWSENKIARRYTLVVIALSVISALAALPLAP